MKLEAVFLLMDDLPYTLQYICPSCGRNNYDMLPDRLDKLLCYDCGVVLEAGESEVHVIRSSLITDQVPPETAPSR